MDRRKFMQLSGGVAVAWPSPTLAQQPTSLPLLAVLSPATEVSAVKRIAALREGLKQAGLVEGTHYALALRFANGDMSRLPELAKELNALGPRVFVAAANAALVVHQQLPNTPLVFMILRADEPHPPPEVQCCR